MGRVESEITVEVTPSFLCNNLQTCDEWFIYVRKTEVCFINPEVNGTNEKPMRFKIHCGHLISCFTSLNLAPDGLYTIVGCSNLIKVIDIASQSVILEWQLAPDIIEDAMMAVGCYPPSLVAVGTDRGTLALFALELLPTTTKQNKKQSLKSAILDSKTQHKSPVSALCLYKGRDGIEICSADESGESIIWQIKDNKLLLKTRAEGDRVPCSSIDHCTSMILLGKLDGSLIFLDKTTGTYIQKIIAHGGPLLALSVHQATFQVSTVSSEGVLRIWEVKRDEKETNNLSVHVQLISNVQFKTVPLTGVHYCNNSQLAISGYDSTTLLIYSCPNNTIS